jgi:hypothetical protein
MYRSSMTGAHVENLKQITTIWHSPEYDGAPEVGFEIIIAESGESSNSQELQKANTNQH